MPAFSSIALGVAAAAAVGGTAIAYEQKEDAKDARRAQQRRIEEQKQQREAEKKQAAANAMAKFNQRRAGSGPSSMLTSGPRGVVSSANTEKKTLLGG